MKQLNKMCIAVLLFSLAACSKKDTTAPSGNEKPPKSKFEMVCQVWTLDETYEDGTRKTTGGTDKYQFTRQGKFQFFYNGNWSDIGTYGFTQDSSAVTVRFMGTSTATVMTLKALNDTELKTEFMAGGKTLNYNYKR